MRFSTFAVATTYAGLAAAKPVVARQTGITIIDETLEVVSSASETIFTQLGDISECSVIEAPWKRGSILLTEFT